MELLAKWYLKAIRGQCRLHHCMNLCIPFSGARRQVAGADCHRNARHNPRLVHQVQAHRPQEDYHVCSGRGWCDDRHTGSSGPEHTDPQVGSCQGKQQMIIKSFICHVSQEASLVTIFSCSSHKCRQLTKDCQMLLFSATFEESVWSFAENIVPDPNIIRLKREEETLDTIKQFYVVCKEKEDKFTALCNLYGTLTIAQAMIFCQVSQLLNPAQCTLRFDQKLLICDLFITIWIDNLSNVFTWAYIHTYTLN